MIRVTDTHLSISLLVTAIGVNSKLLHSGSKNRGRLYRLAHHLCFRETLSSAMTSELLLGSGEGAGETCGQTSKAGWISKYPGRARKQGGEE